MLALKFSFSFALKFELELEFSSHGEFSFSFALMFEFELEFSFHGRGMCGCGIICCNCSWWYVCIPSLCTMVYRMMSLNSNVVCD